MLFSKVVLCSRAEIFFCSHCVDAKAVMENFEVPIFFAACVSFSSCMHILVVFVFAL